MCQKTAIPAEQSRVPSNANRRLTGGYDVITLKNRQKPFTLGINLAISVPYAASGGGEGIREICMTAKVVQVEVTAGLEL